MRTFVIISSFLVVALTQSQNCPPSGCPPIIDPPNCGLPDCSIEHHWRLPHALWPIQGDPTHYWQCGPDPITNTFQPIRRPCPCGLVFNANLYPRRCTWWWEDTWSVPTGCNWQVPPQVGPCDPWCPNCDPMAPGPNITTTTATTTPDPGVTTTTLTTTGSPCGCPPGCPPCIWWPCLPCVPCWCRQQEQQQQEPPMLSWQ